MRSKEENAGFESQMAIKLAVHPELFPSVKIISDRILEIIHTRREEIISKFTTEASLDDIKSALYRSESRGALGCIAKSTDGLTIDEILNDIKTMLLSATTLIQIMPIHATFGYQIGKKLDDQSYLTFRNEVFKEANEFVSKCKQAVKKKAEDSDIEPTTQLGVSDLADICEKINALPETERLKEIINPSHTNSLQRHRVDFENPVLQIFVENNVPLAAGPSTHTVTLLAAARLYEKLLAKEFTKEMQHEYALAYFAYFGTAGYHTFHETMSVAAKCIGFPYTIHSYQENIPAHVRDFLQISLPEMSSEMPRASAISSTQLLPALGLFSQGSSSSSSGQQENLPGATFLQ
ncbi:MAG: hypothetical protein Q8M03_16575 [Legionella sp.]|nr:hypothetical protein [Legionella sp.]